MAMFGEFSQFAGGALVGCAGLMMTVRFCKPTRSHMHLIGFLVGIIVSGVLIWGSVVQFFDPPPTAPITVGPVAVPGSSPYTSAQGAPSPYAPPSKP